MPLGNFFADMVALGNMIWNAGWFVLALYFIKRWMQGIEQKVGDYCTHNRDDHKGINSTLVNHETRISKLEVRLEE